MTRMSEPSSYYKLELLAVTTSVIWQAVLVVPVFDEVQNRNQLAFSTASQTRTSNNQRLKQWLQAAPIWDSSARLLCRATVCSLS